MSCWRRARRAASEPPRTWPRRTDTNANSQATKNPFTSTSAAIANRSNVVISPTTGPRTPASTRQTPGWRTATPRARSEATPPSPRSRGARRASAVAARYSEARRPLGENVSRSSNPLRKTTGSQPTHRRRPSGIRAPAALRKSNALPRAQRFIVPRLFPVTAHSFDLVRPFAPNRGTPTRVFWRPYALGDRERRSATTRPPASSTAPHSLPIDKERGI